MAITPPLLSSEAIMKPLLLTIALLLPFASAGGQTILPNPTNAEAQAPRPVRGAGIPTALAVEAAQAANVACRAAGNRTTTIVIDQEGVPIALISNDGAAAITQRIAMGKAMISLKLKAPSADGAKADPALIAPLGAARPGGLPILAAGQVVAAIAVSGSPTGAADEACARSGIADIQSRLK